MLIRRPFQMHWLQVFCIIYFRCNRSKIADGNSNGCLWNISVGNKNLSKNTNYSPQHCNYGPFPFIVGFSWIRTPRHGVAARDLLNRRHRKSMHRVVRSRHAMHRRNLNRSPLTQTKKEIERLYLCWETSFLHYWTLQIGWSDITVICGHDTISMLYQSINQSIFVY